MPTWLKRLASPSTLSLLLLAGALLAILGAKWSLIQRYGSDVPYMDQWDAEAAALYLRDSEGKLQPSDFLAPHNEHRIVLTRLTNYALYKLDGQWSPLLEMAVNALIHVGALGTLLLFARRHLKPLAFALVAGFSVLLFSIAYAWENTLQGFQSQFYFLTWTAAGAIWLMLGSELFRPRWWAGVAVALLGLGSMSSGLMAAVAIGGTLVFRGLVERRWALRTSLSVMLLVVISIMGFLLSTHVSGHDSLRAANAGEALRSFLACLSWPGAPTLGWAALVPLPFVFLALSCLQQRAVSKPDAILLGWNLWCWLQMLALSIARGHDLPTCSPRYCELFSLAVLGNALILGRCWPGFWNKLRLVVLLPWAVFALSILAVMGPDYETMLHFQFTEMRKAEKRMFSDYIRTHDPELIRKAPEVSKPHPNAELMIQLLQHPGFRLRLPPSLRDPLALHPDLGSSGFVRTEVEPTETRGRVEAWTAEKGPARFTSRPLSATLPVLRLQFKGSATLKPSALYLESADGKRSILEIRRFAGDRWQTAHLQLPSTDKPVRLVAELDSEAQQLSFVNPVELGPLSWMAHHATKAGSTLTTTGLTLLALSFAGLLIRPKTSLP